MDNCCFIQLLFDLLLYVYVEIVSASHKYYNKPSTSYDGIFFRLELLTLFKPALMVKLHTSILIKCFIIEDILVVAQCRWTVDMTEADRSNAWFEACWNSGLLDEYICVTPYCVHYDGLTGMVMIVVLFVHLWLFLYLRLMHFEEHVEYLWKTKAEFS